jgi:hypothetical protein
VDLRCLPTAYSTSHAPQPGLCDCCGLQLNNNDGFVLVCGHGYHLACYNKRCIGEDFDDDGTSAIDEDDEPEETENDQTDMPSRLAAAIENVDYW